MIISIKSGFLTLVAAGIMVGGGIATNTGALAASTTGNQSALGGPGSAVCQQESGDAWTDCAVMLNQPVPAGGEVGASVPSGDGTLAYCEQSAAPNPDSDGDNTVAPAATLCGISGNSAVFTCVDGCSAGTALSFSILSAASTPGDSALAQQITITGGSAAPQAAQPPAAS